MVIVGPLKLNPFGPLHVYPTTPVGVTPKDALCPTQYSVVPVKATGCGTGDAEMTMVSLDEQRPSVVVTRYVPASVTKIELSARLLLHR